MFTVRNQQVAILAKSFSASQLIKGLAPVGQRGTRVEGSDEVTFLDPSGNRSQLKLDEHGRVSECLSPSGERYQFVYDPRHRLSTYREPNGMSLTWDYDDRGRVTGLSQNQNRRWNFEWDGWENLSTITYPDLTSSRMTYSGRRQFAHYTDRAGSTSRFERDSVGRLISIVDPRGNSTAINYNGWDRPNEMVRADGSTESCQRDAAGRFSSAEVNGELWAQAKWDNSGRLREIRYSDDHFLSFEYDEEGRVVQATNPSIAVTRRYDDKGRLIEENQGGRVVRYGYDLAGLLIAITLPAGESLRFKYDVDSKLAEVQDWNGRTHKIQYRDSGRLIRQEFASGVVTERRLLETNQLQKLMVRLPHGGTSPLSLLFEYSINGQIAALDDSEVGRKVFQYDPEGRLLSVVTPSGGGEQFRYDANGNRLRANAETATHNVLDQVISQGQLRTAYDARGNLIELTGSKGTTRYDYNGQNLLVTAHLPDGRRIDFAYDAFARRVAKRVDESTTRYIWAGDQLLCEITEGGPQQSRCDYLFLPGTYVPLALRRDGIVYDCHADGLGTPRWLTDQSGRVVWSASYEAFGKCHWIKQDIVQPLRFPGHYYDEETQLHYNRVRYYAPLLGRYLSRDPLDIVSGLNAYIYASNDPINETDPLGLLGGWAKFAIAAAIVAVGVAAVIVAAPAVLAVAAGTAAFTALTVANAALVVAGGAAIGAGVGLAVAPDGCAECQKDWMIKGALAGAGAALAAMGLAFGAIGAAGGALALAGGGIIASSTVVAAGAAMAAAGVMMTTGSGNIQPAAGGSSVTPEEQAQNDLGELRGKTKADIEADLQKQGYTKTTGKGGDVWTKDLGNGKTSAVRIDPAKIRNPPKNFADEVPHAHKEIVPTSEVQNGNYSPNAPGKTTLDDQGQPSTDPGKTHIPIQP